jgi:hypothetical protein
LPPRPRIDSRRPATRRSVWDDVKWAVCVLLGAAAGYVVLEANDPRLLIGSFVGVVVVILATAVLRWFTRRRST